MQNDMPMVTQMWKSKPEIEFQYGRSLFSETGSSNVSKVDWEMLPKFGLQVDFDLSNWAKSRKKKPEVELARRGRHLETSMWRHSSTRLYDLDKI